MLVKGIFQGVFHFRMYRQKVLRES